MGKTWWENLFGGKEEEPQLNFEELKNSDEFKELVKEQAKELLHQEKIDQERKEDAAQKLHKQQMEEAFDNIELIAETMQDSPEPYLNILSFGFSKEKGIKVKLDYNNAFIRYLNKNGIKARNDEETVRLWLAHLSYDLEQEIIAQDYVINGVSEDEKPNMSYEEMFGKDDEDELRVKDEEPNHRWE